VCNTPRDQAELLPEQDGGERGYFVDRNGAELLSVGNKVLQILAQTPPKGYVLRLTAFP
jgi:hypothetical protein